jgi:hypothetical protein
MKNMLFGAPGCSFLGFWEFLEIFVQKPTNNQNAAFSLFARERVFNF